MASETPALESAAPERRRRRREGARHAGNLAPGAEIRPLILGLDPDDMRVRNLTDDYPGTKDDARIARLADLPVVLGWR